MHKTDHKPPDLSRYLGAEAETLALGAAFAGGLAPGMVIYLTGDLGAGKTTFARGVLRGLGYAGKVRSPTFTLVEVYKFSRLYLYHFDFYRFDDPSEWDDAGFAEAFRGDTVCLVEWPERVAERLPVADVAIRLAMHDGGPGRRLMATAATAAGERCVSALGSELRA